MRVVLFLYLFFVSLFSNTNYCDSRIFNISCDPSVKKIQIIKELCNECGLSLVTIDKVAKDRLNKSVGDLTINRLNLSDTFDILIKNSHLFYKIDGKVLKIYGLKTISYKIDYITSQRSGQSVLNASVQSSNINDSYSNDVNLITTDESFDFWSNIERNIISLLNNDMESYIVKDPIIDQNAGLITVTATISQHERLKRYFKNLIDRLSKEVLISVAIIAVRLDNKHTAGIDWSKFQLSLGHNSRYESLSNGDSFDLDTKRNIVIANRLDFSMEGLINFLQTNGETKVLSKPQIVTLNSQQALITLGDTIWYKVQTNQSIEGSGIPVVSYDNESIFIGILLNILPQISDDNKIMLRINPSISRFKYPEDEMKQDEPRTIAPDISERKLSTVVSVENESTIILGGLIERSNTKEKNGVIFLKDIPLLGNFFKSSSTSSKISELVFVITPTIINPNRSKRYSLKDFSYSKSVNYE